MDADQTKENQDYDRRASNDMSMRNVSAADSAGTDHVIHILDKAVVCSNNECSCIHSSLIDKK
jgi:hypothetical protein